MLSLLCTQIVFGGPPSPTYFLPDAVPKVAGDHEVGASFAAGKWWTGDFPPTLVGGVAHVSVVPADDWQLTGLAGGFAEFGRESELMRVVAGALTASYARGYRAQFVAPWVGFLYGGNFYEPSAPRSPPPRELPGSEGNRRVRQGVVVAAAGAGGLGFALDLGAARGLRFDASIPVVVVARDQKHWSVAFVRHGGRYWPEPQRSLAVYEVGVSWTWARDRLRLGTHTVALMGFSYRHVEPRWTVGATVGTSLGVGPAGQIEGSVRF